ncbi:uncharacterized protein LY89DRAFT_692396 [Mollisia scopiformis]|uniref:Acyltransferase 3 domain-containing protein n=1 Tax=Mollisia scopiformis TaxID=149040 RepID=A0A132B3T5_MOLSC|nr:uncharacterized protein LY89DRAFT_692396 [Mollisia scopiformis]KUJ06584.1 hypothetical protein LY89DRAFT_692396 [Mollisia scopiformis]
MPSLPRSYTLPTSFNMPSKKDSILDAGNWDEIKQDVPPLSPIRRGRSKTWFLDIFRPLCMSKTGDPVKKARRTAYLDGLRGFAAFMVYWHHHQLWAHQTNKTDEVLQHGFGYNNEHHFASISGIRTLFSGGHFAVSIFFVVSGYVLSAKPLSLIQSAEHSKLGDNLSSALFRRWLRLYIPVIATTFLYMTSWHLFGLWTDSEHKGTYGEEVWNWYAEFKNFSFIFTGGGEPWLSYNFHVWSIPAEFRGSIVIFTALLSFSRATRNARLWCEAGLIFYFMYIVDGAFCAMFCAGMLICDLDLLADRNKIPEMFTRFEQFKELIFVNLFVVGIYLGGIPNHDGKLDELKKEKGWYYLSFLKPQAVFDYKWFYLFFAATFIVGSISRIPLIKSFFEMRFNQYLGRISFSLYLVHGPVLWTLGDRLYAATGWFRDVHQGGIPNWVNALPMSKAGPLGMEVGFLVPHLILLPVTFWLAELVTKLFDEPSVTFSQWLYGRTLRGSKL